MINKDRIVPVTKTDLLSLYGTVINLMALLGQGGTPEELPAVPATSADGVYEYSTPVFGICDQPVKSIRLDSSINAAFFFIPNYDFEGIYVNGTRYDDPEEIDASSSNFYMMNYSNDDLVVRIITPLPADV